MPHIMSPILYEPYYLLGQRQMFMAKTDRDWLKMAKMAKSGN